MKDHPSFPRFLALTLLAAFVLCPTACTHEPSPGEVAAQTAKVYYDHLLQGRYADYIDGTYRPDSIPDSYRQQLIDNAKMFVWQMKAEHGGLTVKPSGMKAVAVNSATYHEDTQTADVLLTLTFHNGDVEQILVPMVYRDGLWLMQ